ncbi:MAG: N-acetyltransferase family protein [Candidatus Limnocylindrales bacterium]
MNGDKIRIEPMTDADGPAVLAIYGEGIAAGVATFETVVPEWRAWTASHRKDCRFVARLDQQVVGWTAVARYSSREVYAGVAWESVYVAEAARGLGVGSALLAALIPATEASGIWTLIAGVQANNPASLALHGRAGFRRIGVQERIGRDPFGAWRDVVLLERRSAL